MADRSGKETRIPLSNGREKVEWLSDKAASDGEHDSMTYIAVKPLGRPRVVTDLRSSVYEPEKGLRREVTWQRTADGGQELSMTRKPAPTKK